MTAGSLKPQPGLHQLIDDVGGRKIRSDKVRITWDGIVTDNLDWDPKHPQLELRARSERIGVKPTRVRPKVKFVTSVDPNSLNGKI